MQTNDPMARGGVRRYLDLVKPEDYVPATGEVDLTELSLTGLADLYGTDKGTIKHRYTQVYADIVDRILAGRPRKTTSLQVGEAGIACGSSLRMWATYLPASRISAYDIREECKAVCRDLANVAITIANPVTAPLVPAAYFDLFIDDASHISEDIVAIFNNCWASVKPGGYYIVEDMSCTYKPEYTEVFRRHFNPNVVNDRAKVMGLMDAVMRMVDARQQVAEMSYHPQMLVIRKSPS